MSSGSEGQLPVGSVRQLHAMMSPEVARGMYSNLAGLRTTDSEFILDLMAQYGPEVQVVARVVMTPEHALRVAQLLLNAHQAHLKKTVQVKKLPRKNSGKRSRG
jgi:hypothetical protein